METIGSSVDGLLETISVSDCMKGESRLYVATQDIMVMMRRRKGDSLPPPVPPMLLRAGFMAKGTTFRSEEGERRRRNGERWDSRKDGV